MFIKRCARTYKGKTYQTWWIVESYRHKGKAKHRYLLNVTDYQPEQRERILKLLRDPDAWVVREAEAFFRKGRDYGGVAFFLYQLQELGIWEVFRKALSKKALVLIVAVLLNRLLKPGSKLEAMGWIRGTVYPCWVEGGEEVFQANRLYEAMDEVYAHREEILEGLYRISGGKPVFLLYDITSVYFEGRCVKKAKHGYSRDRRPDRPQVLLGLVLNERGFPVHMEIFDGNVQDGSTVQDVVRHVRERFGLEKAIFVGDRGMVSLKNVEVVTGEGLGYIIALRHEEAKRMVVEHGFQLEIFDVPVTVYRDGGKKYVLCGSSERRERELRVFREVLARGRKGLEEVKKMVERGRLQSYEKVVRRAEKKLVESGARRYYDFRYEGGVFAIVEKVEEIRRAEAMCGYYMLETTEVEMAEEEVEMRYKGLQEVERVFRDLKELIDIRPVYHWVERRVETHILLCLIAQVVLGHVRRKLKEGGWLGKRKANTLASFLEKLHEVKAGEFDFGGKRVYRVQAENELSGVLAEIFGIRDWDWERDREACRV